VNATILEEICARARTDARAARRRVALEELREELPAPAPDFLAALRAKPGVALIAECKRRSPSAGVLREPYDPVELARSYSAGGAAALSCLSNQPYFGGSLAHLEAVARAVDLPVLCKEFVVDEYQIWQARAAGAAALLLIAAALPGAALETLIEACGEARLETLVEVHTGDEMTRAADAGARVIGINNRDLSDFSVDRRRALRLAEQRPGGVWLVAESGVESPRAVGELAEAGFDAVLVGTALVREDDPSELARRLVAAGEGR